MKLLVVGNPENRRVEMFVGAATAAGVAADVVSWLEVVRHGPPPIGDGTVVRLESPGENWAVQRELIRLGRGARDADPDEWDDTQDRGRIRGIGDHHRGFRAVLERFPREASYMSSPEAIVAMFDKVATKRRLEAAGVSTTSLLGCFDEADALLELLDGPAARRVFVKPRHASSASGVIAFARRGNELVATTSVEREDDRLYNSLTIRKYRDVREFRRIIELLIAEDELLVEEWLPKDSAQKAVYDLRFVPVGQRCEHAVMRCSQSPMTNLHLGNRRGDVRALAEELGPTWKLAKDRAIAAAAAFPGASYAGVDVAVTTGRKHAVVLEVNAFGDLLPGVADHDGRSTYDAEIAHLVTRSERI